MSTRAIVLESPTRFMVGVAPGTDTDIFTQQGDHTSRISFRLDMAPWLDGWYQEWKPCFPAGWSVHCVWIAHKYQLQDHLVRVFDADVEWPDYQWSLQSLRARRDRLRARALGAFTIEKRYPPRVVKAYQALNCPIGADLRTITKRYREASHRHHPDKGGSAATMAALNRAIHVLRDYLRPSPAH
jgi:hypothetical protein